nr:uncharacterized protein LOC129279211 [Lytechinus pictus]
MEDGYYGYNLKQTISEQIQGQAKALQALKANNPDLGGQYRSPILSSGQGSLSGDASRPRKWIMPKTPVLNSKHNDLKLERQLAQRQEAYAKEQAWTKKQIEKLTKERLKLEEEEKKLEEARKRWNIPSPPLDPILTPTSSQTGDHEETPEEMQQRIQGNLRKMRNDYEKDKQELDASILQSSKHSYETTQAIQYYMMRDILIDVVNEVVDKCSDSSKLKKKNNMTRLLLAAAEKDYDLSQDFQRKERAMQLISEEIFLQVTAKMCLETVQEWMSTEDYVKSSIQKLIINSAEAIATNNKEGRKDDDPAYDLITATYFHMCKERRKKRPTTWKHTQTVHYIDSENDSVLSGVTTDQDVTKLNMSRLVPVHLWTVKRYTPSLEYYIKRERGHWQPALMTIHPSIIDVTKRVFGVLTIAVSPSQRMLAMGTVRGDIFVFDLWYDSPNPVRYIKNEGASSDGVMHISWSLDSNRIITLNESGSVFMWSLHPGGSNIKDIRSLEFKDSSEEIVPSQLTLLLALDSDADDFDFHEGPLARSRAQTESQIPMVTAFHPSHTLIGSQNSLVVSFESGDIYKCNVEQQITEDSESFQNSENVMFPTVQGAGDTIGQDIPVELFRAHKHAVIYLGYVGNYGNMISVDVKGYIFIWKYTRRKIIHYGWFEPLEKYWLEMADELYVTINNETPEIYFSDDYVLEKKKMKGKNKDRMKRELEEDRKEAELDWDDMKINQVWFKDFNKKLNTETTVYRPDTVDAKGSPFHIIVRQKTTGMLLKHYSQLHKPVQHSASRLLACHPSATGKELVFMLLFPPFPPKQGHITFIIVKVDGQLEVLDRRIDIVLTPAEYEQCYRDDVCSFQMSNTIDAIGSSYIYLNFIGAFMVFSVNTGTLVLSTRKVDTIAAIQWTPKSPTKLWTNAHMALAQTRGSTYVMLYAENQTSVQLLKVTDRNTRDKRMNVNKAFKYWHSTNPILGPRPTMEQTIRRQDWTLKQDPFGHVTLYLRRLILKLVDDAVQKVDGEFSEENRKIHAEQDQRLAHRFFGVRLKGPGAVEEQPPDQREDEIDLEQDNQRIQPVLQGDDIRDDETEEHPTV